MTERKPVLVVVDMQIGFVRPQSAHVVPIIAQLVERWQVAGMDTLFTRFLNYPDSPFERFFEWTKLQSPPETDIVPELTEAADRATAVLDKRIYSPFNDEGSTLFTQKGWTDLYICGVATESCVLKTAVDAWERNLTPWIVADASASHAGSVAHEAGLLVARRFIGPNQLIATYDAAPHAVLNA